MFSALFSAACLRIDRFSVTDSLNSKKNFDEDEDSQDEDEFVEDDE